MSSDDEYLAEIRALSFQDRTWSLAEIEDTRDFLAPWNHNIRLAPGVYTVFDEDPYPEHEAIMDTVRHHAGRSLQDKRVLDLGCLEGYFSIECAMNGAEVLGVDARELNIKKCEFVKAVLGVENVQFAIDDALNATRENHGSFDIVLALGLLYHLDDPFTFLRQIAELCKGFLVLDTLIALEDGPQTIDGWQPELSELREFTVGDGTYHGRLYREFEPGADDVERAFSTTAAHANDLAVWLTNESLVALMTDSGFEALERVVFPRAAENWWSDPGDGRVLYVARTRREFASRVFTG